MYLPDPIERAEARAENWAFDNIKGDMFKCGCDKWGKLCEAETLSPDPYAIPVCHDCVKAYYKNIEKKC